jgi:hypothetical protein
MTSTSLRALLNHIVDYAGLYPPASLPLPDVVANYQRYLRSQDGWMLNRLVLPLDKLATVKIGADWRLSVLVEGEPGTMPPQVQTLESKGFQRLSLPTYCEAPLDQIVDGFAKIRTNVPDVERLADFLCAAAKRRLPFKATAGLHRPIRTEMHGFLNVFVGAAFAWSGMDRVTLARLLKETDCGAFQFQDEGLFWRESHLSTAQIKSARKDFAHSFGSCSFEEPVAALRHLCLLV